MDVSNCLKKFTLVLDHIFDGKIVLNEYKTEKLLSFFEDRSDNSSGKRLLDTPCFSDLIFNWLKTVSTSSTPIKLLFVEIVTKLFKNELQFNKLQMQGIHDSSLQYCILGNLSSKTCPALQLATIKLATAQITHCSGVKLLLEHKIWEHILCPDIYQKPANITKAAYDCISKLVQTLNHYEKEDELIEVLKYVLKPIIESEYLTLVEIDDETDIALAEKLWTHLNVLLTILTDMENEPDNHVYNLLRSYFCVEHSIYFILRITRCTKLIILLNDIEIRIFYTATRNMFFTNKIDEVCSELVAFYHNLVLNCIQKRDVHAVIHFSVQCFIFWSKFEKTHKDTNAFTVPLTFERNGQIFELCNQVIVHVIEPLFLYAYVNQSNNMPEKDDLVEAMHTKMTKSITEHILSSCYSFRTLIEGSDLKKIAIDAIRQLFRLKSHLNPSQAGITFQVLYHILNLFILSDGAGRLILEENPMKCPDDVKLLSLVLDAIRMIMKEHNISWYENVEIISLQEGLMNLMKQNILNSKQAVQVLDLIDICVNKFLSPNMTLLVESRQDSTLTEIGAIMNMYMQHEEWEVRDSATTLLLSCTDIAFIKYVPLQQVIRENNLMILAAKIALTDAEYYAQSTGLKCLAAATKLESIWREVVMDNPHIYLQLIYVLRNHPEGMVRKEAAKVLTGVYKNQKIIPTFQNTLNEVMMVAALDDLHWEVQLEALDFWKHTIKNHLSHRGMIDGKFPTVTFSKEKRKIIKLNDKEIINQLTFVMNDLSSIGCLTVLLECMNEGYNIEIIEKAYKIARELIEILDKHKFAKITNDFITSKQEQRLEKEDRNNEFDMAIDFDYKPDEELRNKVIDSILETDLCELILDLHDNQIKSEFMEEDHRVSVPRREMVHPNKFLETLKDTDYLTIITDKKNWNVDVYRNFCAMLDEFLDI